MAGNKIEASQQSGRVANRSRLQRENPMLFNLIYQFKTAPLLQHQFVISAIRDVANGVPGAKKRFCTAILANHILQGSAMFWINQGTRALLGFKEDYDEKFWLRYAKALILGNFREIYMAGALGANLYDVITGAPRERGRGEIPVEGIFPLAMNTADALAAKPFRFIVDQLRPGDFEKVEFSDVLNALDKALRSWFAPWRHARQAIENRKDD